MPFFSVRSNLADITRLHNKLYRFMVVETRPIAARIHIEFIKKRSSGAGFGPPGYTPRYAAWRAAKGLQTTTIDFRVNGRLLDRSLHATPTGIAVQDSDAGQAEGLSGKRDWMNVDTLGIDEIEKALAAAITRL